MHPAIPIMKTVDTTGEDFFDDTFGAIVESVVVTNTNAATVTVKLYDGVGGPQRYQLLAPANSTTPIPLYGAKFTNRVHAITDIDSVILTVAAIGVG